MAWGDLPRAGHSFELTNNVQKGLTAISVLAFISFVSSAVLFTYLTYKLIWHYNKKTPTEPISHDGFDHQQTNGLQRRIDFALGIDGVFADHGEGDQKPIDTQVPTETTQKRTKQPPNQFLLLIFNLLLADMHQGVAFLLNVEWLRYGMIRVGTPTCFVQGLFISLGDLASSCFITMIAVHTYLSVVKRYMMPQRMLYIVIVSIWFFVYAVSLIPIAATLNGAKHGGFFVRAGVWCWMNIEYAELRLATHYLFIFIGLATTSGLYATIFMSLRREARASASCGRSGSASSSSIAQFKLSHNPAFLIYPVIYVVCTLPLALGRIFSMAGRDPPLGYMCFAGALISANGMFDCMLFGTTRNVIVFASKYDVDSSSTGLDTFAFMQTPRARRYGNMVWVQGGGGRGSARAGPKNSEDKTAGGWWSWQRLGGGADDKPERPMRTHRRAATRGGSQESLRGPAEIQMDTVTTVVVEMEHDKEHDIRYPDPSKSARPSMTSTDTRT